PSPPPPPRLRLRRAETCPSSTRSIGGLPGWRASPRGPPTPACSSGSPGIGVQANRGLGPTNQRGLGGQGSPTPTQPSGCWPSHLGRPHRSPSYQGAGSEPDTGSMAGPLRAATRGPDRAAPPLGPSPSRIIVSVDRTSALALSDFPQRTASKARLCDLSPQRQAGTHLYTTPMESGSVRTPTGSGSNPPD